MSSTPLPNWDIASPVAEFLMRHILDVDSGWSCGSFGAIAEFIRTPDEPVRFDSADALVAVTDRGGIRIDPGQEFRPIAYEMTSRDPETWQQGVALCLPLDHCAMNRRSVLTELGPDQDALRPEDRTAILFDIGMNVPQADICVRTSDPRTLERLRAGIGRSLFEPGSSLAAEIPSLSPHRVFQCRFGRIEVYQAIPAPDGKSPDGPHTHVLPKLLAHDRTHAANLPIPDGWVPCMTLFPANPMRDRMGDRKPFDPAEFAAFQDLWQQFGEPELVAIKARALAAAGAGREFPEPDSRAGRMVAEVALRQAAKLVGEPQAL